MESEKKPSTIFPVFGPLHEDEPRIEIPVKKKPSKKRHPKNWNPSRLFLIRMGRP